MHGFLSFLEVFSTFKKVSHSLYLSKKMSHLLIYSFFISDLNEREIYILNWGTKSFCFLKINYENGELERLVLSSVISGVFTCGFTWTYDLYKQQCIATY